MEKSLAKQEREKIFETFLKHHEQKFSEIEKQLEIRSNHLVYHIDQMIKDELLKKENSIYTLTKKAEKLIPFFAHITDKELGALSVVLVAILNKEKTKIALLKREKRPYKDYWGLIGGKLKLEESIEETAVRETKEETHLDCKFNKIHAILHERVKENEKVKHAFILFLTTVTAESEKIIRSEEGKVEWFDIKDINEKIIPSDLWMINNCLDKTSDLKQIIIEDKDQELSNMIIT